MIVQQFFFFDKTYHLVLKNSIYLQPESAPSVHPKVHFFKVYFFVSCFPTMSLNRTKLKYRTMKLKAYENVICMIELGATYLLGPKDSLLVHPECAI